MNLPLFLLEGVAILGGSVRAARPVPWTVGDGQSPRPARSRAVHLDDLTFLVLLALLAKFAWRPLLQALESRQSVDPKSLDDAQQAKVELERLRSESAQIITRGARRGRRRSSSQSRADGGARCARDEGSKARAEADAHRQERRAPDSARNDARAPADPHAKRSISP